MWLVYGKKQRTCGSTINSFFRQAFVSVWRLVTAVQRNPISNKNARQSNEPLEFVSQMDFEPRYMVT